MAKPTELENKRTADRRLALLALVGDQPEQAGSCPAAEELAALVEGRLAPEQRRQTLAHLAACEHCYALWRRLDLLHQEHLARRPHRTLIRLFSRPKVLAATGSLLAAAASLAVFLTLTARVDRVPHLLLNQRAQEEQARPRTEERSIPVPVPAPPPAEHRADEVRSLPAPAPPAADLAAQPPAASQPGRARKEAIQPMLPPAGSMPDAAGKGIPVGSNAAAVQSKAESGQMTEPLPEKKRRQEEMFEAESLTGADSARSGQTRQAAPPARASEDRAVHTGQWQERIRSGCRKGGKPNFFSAMEQEGKKLLRESRLSKEERERIERMLVVLGKREPAETRCRELLELIGPTAGK